MTNSLERLEWQKLQEVPFSELTPEENDQLYTVDSYFAEKAAPEFCVGKMKISARPYCCTTSLI